MVISMNAKLDSRVVHLMKSVPKHVDVRLFPHPTGNVCFCSHDQGQRFNRVPCMMIGIQAGDIMKALIC